MYKFYLIYIYHDTYIIEFNDSDKLYKHLEELKKEYKNDRDFRYQIIRGIKLESSIESND